MGRRGGDAKGKGGKGGRDNDGRNVVRVVLAAQSHSDKVLAKVVQPLSRHYNGQGCAKAMISIMHLNAHMSERATRVRRLVRPSDYVPLSDDAFFPTFHALWDAHIDFGTNRSHKKLLGKKRKSEATPIDAVAKSMLKQRKRPSSESGLPAVSAAPSGRALPSETTPRAPAAAPSSEQLANKGRWGSTMAARLLGGGI